MCSALRSFVFLQNQHFPDQNIYVHTFVEDICLWKTVPVEIFWIAAFWRYTAKCLPFYHLHTAKSLLVDSTTWRSFHDASLGLSQVSSLVQDVPKTNIHICSQEEGNYGSKHSVIGFIIFILNMPAIQSFITCSQFTKIKVMFDIIYTF